MKQEQQQSNSDTMLLVQKSHMKPLSLQNRYSQFKTKLTTAVYKKFRGIMHFRMWKDESRGCVHIEAGQKVCDEPICCLDTPEQFDTVVSKIITELDPIYVRS